MDDLVRVWLEFGVCLFLIAVAGSRLSRYGDVIAEKTGLSGTWIGIVMLATVTSLPELVTGLSAVLLAEAPDIAVGSIFGSCVFNLSIIVLIDLAMRRDSVYERTSNGLIVSAAYGLILIGFAAMALLLEGPNGWLPSFGHVGITTPVIIIIYFLAMRSIFRFESEAQIDLEAPLEESYAHLSLGQAAWRYTAASAVVVGVGIYLPLVGSRLGDIMGWQDTFVGNLFIALATSLPEMVVTVAAARLGAFDMAVGNLFGSNLFNILILAINDLAYMPGSLMVAASDDHLISAMSAMLMTGLAVVGIFLSVKKRPLLIGWVSIFLLLAYLVNSIILFRLGR